jgi:hypothetical protein
MQSDLPMYLPPAPAPAKAKTAAPASAPVRHQRPIKTAFILGVIGIVAGGFVEYVIADHTRAAAATEEWGRAFLVASIVFSTTGMLGLRVIGYLASRRAFASLLIPLFVVIGCLVWSGFQLSGALAEGDAKAAAAQHRASDDYAFAKKRIAASDAAIASLDVAEASIDESAIVGRAQAASEEDAAARTTERARLSAERSRAFTFVANADPATQADAIAAAQRRLRGIDAEITRLLDTKTVSEPYKFAEVEIAARRAGIAQRRANALAERAKYLPTVQKGDVITAHRSPENIGLAALILALIIGVTSAFQIPAKSPDELDAEKREAKNAEARAKYHAAKSGGTAQIMSFPPGGRQGLGAMLGDVFRALSPQRGARG